MKNLLDMIAADPGVDPALRQWLSGRAERHSPRRFTGEPPTDWDQLAQDDRDTFDARLDAMPEPLGGDDE